MSLIKRIATTVHASVDRTVASLENHDARVQSALKDAQRSVAKANVKLSQLEATAQRQQANIDELTRRIETWSTRAKSIAETDKEKALDCLVQRQADQRLLNIALKQQTSHRQLLLRTQANVAELKKRVSDLQIQYQDLQSRDAVAQATTQLGDIERCSHANINDTFERWEVSIQAQEIQNSHHAESTGSHAFPLSLDDEFAQKENQEALQQELEALIKSP